MSVSKRNGKWYIQGNIKREDGTYYRYTKLARGCKYVNEAREYETEFVKQWQAIQVAKYNKTFAELAEEYLAQAVSANCLLASSIIFATFLFPSSDSNVGSDAQPPTLKSIATLKNTANSFFIFISLHVIYYIISLKNESQNTYLHIIYCHETVNI